MAISFISTHIFWIFKIFFGFFKNLWKFWIRLWHFKLNLFILRVADRKLFRFFLLARCYKGKFTEIASLLPNPLWPTGLRHWPWMWSVSQTEVRNRPGCIHLRRNCNYNSNHFHNLFFLFISTILYCYRYYFFKVSQPPLPHTGMLVKFPAQGHLDNRGSNTQLSDCRPTVLTNWAIEAPYQQLSNWAIEAKLAPHWQALRGHWQVTWQAKKVTWRV